MVGTLCRALMLLLFCFAQGGAAEQVQSQEGYFVLHFEEYEGRYDTLQIISLDDAAKTVRVDVTGQRQATLSGFADGHYQARLLSRDPADPPRLLAEIEVSHHSLEQALALFFIGLLAFLFLLTLLLVFQRREQNHA
ncbi:hypothetical protein P2G88_14370 [Aliiglaciecola sp. CAU 1673]|uniref:hypothetical protein n=1 Tax=Aliiglaciecola sp. CAU 1673 TaxID=3032595 RepID=UPI0023DBD94F|nr:hypothetical protein [Aliiglaciecola sp. CAU 1673]MDF2179436.1 hypothetical protein [Aliiglaciecola sp. CAU 1673]